MKIATISAIAGVGAVVVGLGLWGKLGWMTPEEHKTDFQHIEEHAQRSEDAIKEFQNRWLCDENTEELAELLVAQNQTPLDFERIRKLRARMDEWGCHIYDD